METNEHTDRRLSPRIAAVGTAVVHGEQPSLRARIVDIAAGGVLVQTPHATSLAPWRDRAVSVDIRLDGRTGHWLTAIGRVCRLEPATGQIAVRFETVPTELQDLLESEVTAFDDGTEQQHVILVRGPSDRDDSIAQLFRAAGCHVDEVSSTRDALTRLGKSRYAPELIVLDDALPEQLAEELRDYLCDGHPGARVAVMGSEPPATAEIRVRELVAGRPS